MRKSHQPDLSQVENKLTVGTYNVRNFRISGQWDKDTRDEKLRQTLAFVQNTQPDIFCGQVKQIRSVFLVSA